jgi:hypothetical protein
VEDIDMKDLNSVIVQNPNTYLHDRLKAFFKETMAIFVLENNRFEKAVHSNNMVDTNREGRE